MTNTQNAPLRAHDMAPARAAKRGRPAGSVNKQKGGPGVADRKGLDLAAVLRVSDSDIEQIVRLPIDDLIPDPENFYSLDGLNELAGNIELLGLLDPIRVRPYEGKFMIVSGHRRWSAILLIRDGGSDQFAAGVPCIVEYGEASEAMRKLRLIYANSSTRQLSSAELSRQAEEVTRLLYELQAQGVEFPGRMRDHVAQACGVAKSKIARLHAIRENLHPALLPYYDDGEMVEDVAYQLSRFPEDLQAALSDKLADGKKRKMPIGSVVEAVWKNLDELQKPMSCRAHAGGPECHHATARIVSSLCRPYSWNICDGGKCCLDCWHAKEGCSGACREARDRVKLEKAVEEERAEARKRDEEIAQRVLKNRIRDRAQALLPYVEKAGLDDKERISGDYRSATVGQLRKWAEGDFGEAHFYGDECVRPGQSKDAIEMAKKLRCSLELALGVREWSASPKESNDKPAGWREGTPEREGWYAVRLLFLGKPLYAPRVFYWNGEAWVQSDGIQDRPLDKACEVQRWTPLPDMEE